MPTVRERLDSSGRKTYHVQIRIKGFPPQTQTFDSKTVAKQWAAQVESDLRLGRYMPRVEAQRHTVQELLDDYRDKVLIPRKPKEVKIQVPQLAWWCKQLGKYSLADLTPAAITQCRDELLTTPIGKTKSRHRTPATVVRYMGTLSQAFNVAVNEWQWMQESPMPKVVKPKVDNARTRFLTDEERERLLIATKSSESKYLYAIVLLAISTGMRRGEILSLKWRHVILNSDSQSALVILEHTKNKTQRGIPLVGAALAEIERLRHIGIKANHDRENPDALLFPSDRDSGKPLQIRKAWCTAVSKAKLDSHFKFHDLRHTAASYLAMNGVMLRDIAEILGHKSMDMVKRYSHLSKDHLLGVMNQLNTRLQNDASKGK